MKLTKKELITVSGGILSINKKRLKSISDKIHLENGAVKL